MTLFGGAWSPSVPGKVRNWSNLVGPNDVTCQDLESCALLSVPDPPSFSDCSGMVVGPRMVLRLQYPSIPEFTELRDVVDPPLRVIPEFTELRDAVDPPL